MMSKKRTDFLIIFFKKEYSSDGVKNKEPQSFIPRFFVFLIDNLRFNTAKITVKSKIVNLFLNFYNCFFSLQLIKCYISILKFSKMKPFIYRSSQRAIKHPK